MGASYGYGPESWMSVAEETVWGTFKTTGQKYCRIHGESMKKDRGIKAISSVLTGAPGNNRIVTGFEKVGGDVQPECLFEGGILTFLKHLMGSVATTGPTDTAAYTHTFSMATALPVGLSVEVSKGNVPADKVNKYAGCKVSKGVFTWAAEDLWRQAYTLVGKTELHNQTKIAAPTYATDTPVYWWYAAVFSFCGVSSKIKSGSLTIDNALDDSRFLFEKTISEPYRNGKRTVTGSFILELTDWSLYDCYVNDTEAGLTLSFISTVTIPTCASTVYSWTIQGTKCRLTGGTPIVNTEGIIELPIEFVMRAPSTGNDEITMTVINGQTTI